MIESINSFFATDTASYIYWISAILGTTFFIVFTIMAFIFSAGTDVDIDSNMDVDASIHDSGLLSFKIFSIHSILSFLMFFGWGGLVFGNSLAGFVGALGLGFVVMVFIALLLKFILKLQDAGEKAPSYIGLKGSVYINIESGRITTGRVNISTVDGLREILAVADTQLLTGTLVRVVEKIDESIYLVEKL